MKWATLGLLACTSILAFAQAKSDNEQDPLAQSLHLDWLDTRVAPQQDFYMYANGNWKIENPIPDDYASWGSFSILQEKNQIAIHKMVAEIAKNSKSPSDSLQQKVGDFYYSGMDLATINKVGIKPLTSEFAQIEAIQSMADLQAEIEHLHQYGINVGFTFQAMQDFDNSTQMIAAIAQAGLSLPNKDYYLKTDKKFVAIRKAFLNHMKTMLQFLGDKSQQTQHEAQVVMRIETELAKGSMSQITQRDPHAIYHLMSLDQLSHLSTHFDWTGYFQARGYSDIKHLNVAMPEFIRTFDGMLATVSLNDWKIYLKWHVLNALAPYLSDNFVKQNFKMSAILSGVKSLPPRWKQVIGTESGMLGFAIGELYVQKHFSPEAKQQVLDMITHIRQVLRKDLSNLAWMTEETRKAAIKKLDKMEDRVGYPDKWWDYSTLQIDRGPYVLNVLRSGAFLVKRELDKVGKPIDRTEWAMTPQTVNAYYDPSMNSINIPMGILQSPYFDPAAPVAINYGGIGVVIGHEITHGFDDQGSQFDEQGNLHNWWTDEDLKKFKAATQCITNQFSHYTVNGSIPVQGGLVVGEATADLGGVTLAYRAFHAAENYDQQATIRHFNPDQQFFLSFAHIWANNIRPEHAHHLILLDPHPPTQYRVNGSLANIPQFKKDFQVSEPTLMVNPNPCVIW